MKVNVNRNSFGKTFKVFFYISFLLSGLFSLAIKAQSNFDTIEFQQAFNQSHPTVPISWAYGILTPNNCDYFEGIGIPQRVIFTGIVPTTDNVHTLTFRHQAVKAGIHAYDFLMSWTQAVQTAVDIGNGSTNELQNLISQQCNASISVPGLGACTSATYHSAPSVPDIMGDPITVACGFPPQVDVNSVIACFENTYGNRTIDIYGDAAITASSLTFNGYANSSYDSYATYTLTWTSSSTRIVILMAGRLAQSCAGPCRSGYSEGCGAGSVYGGPFHFKLYDLDGHTLGNQDNQVWNGQFGPVAAIVLSDSACNIIALPVELLSLQAALHNDVVTVSWETASEINNDYFDIERSRDGINFEKIGTKKGAGNSTEEINYSLDDSAPWKGINYYRLRQVDYDGKYTYSQKVYVNFLSDGLPISIYPNPTSGDFTFSLTGEENSWVDVQVFNHLGQLIFSESEEIHSDNFLKSISLNERPDGLYYVRVLVDGRSYSLPVIKRQ